MQVTAPEIAMKNNRKINEVQSGYSRIQRYDVIKNQQNYYYLRAVQVDHQKDSYRCLAKLQHRQAQNFTYI